MSNKKVGSRDIAAQSRAAIRYLAHKDRKSRRKQIVAEHNREFSENPRLAFSHKDQRRSNNFHQEDND